MSQPTFDQQLEAVFQRFEKVAPAPAQEAIKKSLAEVKQHFDLSQTIKTGAKLPAFALPDAVGSTVNSEQLLGTGPMLLTFYRGGWCPYCNIALAGLQQNMAAFRAKGVTVVAISPELPNTSLSTVEKNALEFKVLSDVGNKYAQTLGIVWKMPDYLRPTFQAFHPDFAEKNGDDSFAVPLPATLLVDATGTVRNTYIEPDYSKRLDPKMALKWIDEL